MSDMTTADLKIGNWYEITTYGRLAREQVRGCNSKEGIAEILSIRPPMGSPDGIVKFRWLSRAADYGKTCNHAHHETRITAFRRLFRPRPKFRSPEAEELYKAARAGRPKQK